MSVVSSERSVSKHLQLYLVLDLQRILSKFLLNEFNLRRNLKKHKKNVIWYNNMMQLLNSIPVQTLKTSITTELCAAIANISKATELHPSTLNEYAILKFHQTNAQGNISTIKTYLISLKNLIPQIKDATLIYLNKYLDKILLSINYWIKNRYTQYMNKEMRKMQKTIVTEMNREAAKTLDKIILQK